PPSAQKQTGLNPALERTRIQFVQSHSPTGDLGFLVAFVSVPRQRIRGELRYQLLALFATKLAGALVSSHLALIQQSLHEASRQMATHNRTHPAGGFGSAIHSMPPSPACSTAPKWAAVVRRPAAIGQPNARCSATRARCS